MKPLAYRMRPARRGVSLEAISQTEKVVAFCRVLLAAATLVIAIVDPMQPSYRPDLGYVVLGGYFLFSVALFWLVRGEHVRGRRVGPYSAVADVVWIAAIALFTDRGATPFFLLNIFVISSVSIRWGFAVSAPLTILLALLYPALFFVARLLDPEVFAFHRAHLFRPVFLIALGYLVGYLGEHERRSKRKLGFMLELTTELRRRRAPGWGLTRLMRRVLDYFDAPRGVLVLLDPESGNYFTWDLSRRNGRPHVRLRITPSDPLLVSFARPTEALLVNAAPGATGSALCYDVVTGARRKVAAPVVALPDGAPVHTMLVVPVLIQRELRGRAVVVRDGRPRFTRDDLEFLLVIAGQAATGFEAARLQEKAEEVAVLEERARIARDLHDGFIQSLAGIDLRVEACRKLVDRDPSRIPRQLEDLHQMVERGYREVRHYLTVLRSASRKADDLCATLDQLAAEFSIREHLRVELALPAEDPGLPATMVYELGQIVREALRNAVRHGRATEAVVEVVVYATYCHVTVRDNGRGFQNVRDMVDADGYLTAAAAPWSIRDRAAVLGGALRIRTRAGDGVEVQLRVPLTGPGEGDAEARKTA
jgi:signal transduction histidine kinase